VIAETIAEDGVLNSRTKQVLQEGILDKNGQPESDVSGEGGQRPQKR